MERITFLDEANNENIEFEVIDQTVVEGIQYLLVADEDDEAVILKAIKDDGDNVTYALIEDDLELQKVTLIFLESDEYDIEV